MEVMDILYQTFTEEKEREDNIIYVTDLCRCPLKAEFERRYPIIKVKILPQFVVGSLIHAGLQQLLEKHGFRIEVEGCKQIENYEIHGRIDAIKGETGVEIKFSRSDQGIPYEHHKLQCAIYNWLFGLRKTILVYITPDRVAEYKITNIPDDYTIKKLIEWKEYPRYHWECKYCEYSIICPYKK